jgi:molybdenum cofactor cytidylyltransferase
VAEHRRDLPVTGIILAAGMSTRFGRPKQLLDLAGKPMLQHLVDAAAAAPLDELVLVLGHLADRVEAAVRRPAHLRVVVNPRYAEGLATSVLAGLRAARPDAGAAVILPGDEPEIRAEAIRAVVEAWRAGGGPVVQASYGGEGWGAPQLVDRSVWPEVERALASGGDEGARRVWAAHPEWRVLVEVGGRRPRDIDTERDYEEVRRRFQRP